MQISNIMKKFIIKILLFAIIIGFADIFIGSILYRTANKAIGGDFQKSNYIANKLNAEVVIMGSSRANHHYVPNIFKDSLNMTCYNAGDDGMGIILMYGRYKLLTNRYTPNIIIYDIQENFDLDKNDNIKYLNTLKHYYEYPGVSEIFHTVDKKEAIKMNSRLYRYNSRIIGVISNTLFTQVKGENGYLPLYGTMNYEPEQFDNQEITYDSLKLKYFEQLIKDCSNKTNIIITLSPKYFKTNDSFIKPLQHLCKQYNVPILNHLNDERFIKNKELFKDRVHLNDNGAHLYTDIIIQEIKDLNLNNKDF